MARDPLAEARAALASEQARFAAKQDPPPVRRRQSRRSVQVKFTSGQIRAVNSALALLEATPDLEDAPHPATLRRAREQVWAAMERAEIDP